MKKINDSMSRKVEIHRNSSDYYKAETELLRAVKATCDKCPERIFCESAYDIRGCNGRSQSDR